MIQDTCNFKECYLGKLLDKPEECPNFMQSVWKSEQTRNEMNKLNELLHNVAHGKMLERQ
jgi:hypothetical protein